MKNIELKIKVDTLENVRAHGALREKLASNNAQEETILHQIDTYFKTEKGRLKLREINSSEYELIYYERPDESESKVSMYEIISFDKAGAEKIKAVFSATNGIKVVVEKKRELWLYNNTRVHLDRVEGLGEYIELETVVQDISMDEAQKEHQEVVRMLSLDDYKKCELSYSDILLNRFE